MRGLLDVNVLIALFDEMHQHHEPAKAWFASSIRTGWASCPITQNGFIRVISQPRYPRPVPVRLAVERLAAATATRHHAYWPDELSLTEPDHFDVARIHGPKQLTDVYLLGLAVQRGGRLVTFDDSIALAAVIGATPDHLMVL